SPMPVARASAAPSSRPPGASRGTHPSRGASAGPTRAIRLSSTLLSLARRPRICRRTPSTRPHACRRPSPAAIRSRRPPGICSCGRTMPGRTRSSSTSSTTSTIRVPTEPPTRAWPWRAAPGAESLRCSAPTSPTIDGTQSAEASVSRSRRKSTGCWTECALALLATARGAGGAEAAAAPPAPAAPAPAPSGLMRWFDPATAPFIPIPAIDTEPHSGLTLGLIPTWLRTSERDEIERIIAPDLIHSQYFGWGSHMPVLSYPSADTQGHVVGGLKERVEREFDGRYLTGLTRHGAVSWSVEAIYDRSGTQRFFGLGNQSVRGDETSYINNQA